jgi:glycosyltransferase involved in cell wall biosynthesis
MQPLDFVIPVYNEGENIRAVLEALRKDVKPPFRALICYDHDGDTTLEALRGFDPGFPVIPVKNAIRPGPHGAVVSGFRASTAPHVLVIPADDDYNAAAFQRMREVADSTGADIVCASRFIPGGTMQGAPWLKATLRRSSAVARRHLARLPTPDPSNGLRLFSRRVLDSLEIESTAGFTYSIELLVKAHRLGWQVAEVPARWFERTKGQSRFRVLAWAPRYLQWFCYAFATTYLRRPKSSVRMRPPR